MLGIYIDIAFGKELPEKVAKILIKAYKIGDEMHLSFVNNSYKKKS